MKKITDVYGIDNRLLDEIAHRAYKGKPLIEHLGAERSFAGGDLKNVVTWLRELTGGAPISLKFCASRIKEDKGFNEGLV